MYPGWMQWAWLLLNHNHEALNAGAVGQFNQGGNGARVFFTRPTQCSLFLNIPAELRGELDAALQRGQVPGEVTTVAPAPAPAPLPAPPAPWTAPPAHLQTHSSFLMPLIFRALVHGGVAEAGQYRPLSPEQWTQWFPRWQTWVEGILAVNRDRLEGRAGLQFLRDHGQLTGSGWYFDAKTQEDIYHQIPDDLQADMDVAGQIAASTHFRPPPVRTPKYSFKINKTSERHPTLHTRAQRL